MTATIKASLVQFNSHVGDIAYNFGRGLDYWKNAEAQGADIVVLHEQWLSGYPLMDQVENPDLLDSCEKGLERLLYESKSMKSAMLVCMPIRGKRLENGRDVYNAAILIEAGEVRAIRLKQKLPTYDVFDEARNYAAAGPQDPIEFRGLKLGVPLCEDGWYDDLIRDLADKGAQVFISPNGSPFECDKYERRRDKVVGARVAETGIPYVYVNQVGGQDELVFDGGSMAIDKTGALVFQAPFFEEYQAMMTVTALPGMPADITCDQPLAPIPCVQERTYKALVMAVRDYCDKNFGPNMHVVIGMSGGLDSAFVAALAVDALGPERVHLISMPYHYTSDVTRGFAAEASRMLGADFHESPIKAEVEALLASLTQDFNMNAKSTLTEENGQSRVRGMKLMALSNFYHWLLLSTGNKSEVSVGYCTLYGDMNGGYNPIKDLYKNRGEISVKNLALWRNQNWLSGLKGPQGPVMPHDLIIQPPSAELAEGQTDEASLGDYETQLDPVLQLLIEQDLKIADIIAQTGLDAAYVHKIARLVDLAEFKRKQGCPGPKVSAKSFGSARRYPISRPTTARMVEGADLLLDGI